jgi:DNA-binding transcriptional LysR family regulator
MVADGRLDAAIVTLPLTEKDLFSHPICREKLLVCLRRDDPLAHGVQRQLLFRFDDSYFSLRTTSTAINC